MKKFSIIMVLLFLVCAFFSYAEFAKNPAYANSKAKITLSRSQKKVVKKMGEPDVFMLAMAKEGRFEAWTYFKWNRSFIFMDGKFIESKHFKGLPAQYKYMWPENLKPEQFKAGMSQEEIIKILGQPIVTANIKPEVAESIRIYDYADLAKVAFENNKLIYVQTFPVPIKNYSDIEK